MNPFRASFRIQFLLGFLACAALLGYAFHTQFRDVNPLEPCPLCIFQRIAFFALGIVFLLGALHGPVKAGWRRVYGVLALIAGGAGIAVASRHVWITLQPPGSVPSCGAPFEFMRQTMGPLKLIQKVMTGSGECAKVDWTFLGMSMPAWSLVCLVLLTVWGAYAAFRRR
ncbi:disulfide bond formation protein B [Lysobacter yangpyeongensis]|uniref:Disulfide bond formation protein B n=1 Tax=Lysobacter yangpyeongensis TaxID=346182 RepID=A0ABW0SM08_9GAMM